MGTHHRPLDYEMLEQRRLLAGDIQIRFDFTDLAEAPISSAEVGDSFLLKAYVQDIRVPTPQGVAQAYVDVSYNDLLVSVNGSITHGVEYSNVPSGDTASILGLVDNVGGAVNNIFLGPPDPAAEYHLFSVPFQADAVGNWTTSAVGAGQFGLEFSAYVDPFPNFNTIPFADVDVVNDSITITDDTATLGFAAASSSVAEDVAGGTHTVDVVLSIPGAGTLAEAVSVDIDQLGSSTAADPDDYSLAPATVTFPTGSADGATQTLTLTINNDALVEGDETADLQLTNLTGGGGTVTIDATADDHQVTINDDDTATVGFAAPSSGVDEDIPSGTHTVDVVLSFPGVGTLAEAVSLNVDQLGSSTAVDPDDYSLAPTTVTFPAGSADGATQTLTLSIIDDALVEGDETADLQLTGLTGGGGAVTINGAADAHQVTITDDDQPSISITPDVHAPEGDSGTSPMTFVVSLSQVSPVPVSVWVNTADDTATVADNDYVPVVDLELIFEPGQAITQNVDVDVVGDTKREDNEVFFVGLSSPTNAEIGSSPGEGHILNDDIEISIRAIPSSSVPEGDSGDSNQAAFEIRLSDPVDVSVVAQLDTADGTAVAGEDYVAIAGQPITFNPQDPLTQIVYVDVIGDDKLELDEDFTVDLSILPGAAVMLGNASATGTILNDDNATLSIDDVSQAETDAGTTNFDFTVTLDAEVDHAVAVDISTQDGTATTADGDYVFKTETITFPANAGGPQTQTFTVAVNGDLKVELDEFFFAILNEPSLDDGGRGVTILDNSGTGTIENDDQATISIDDVSQVETNSGTTSFVFNVTLGGVVDHDVSIYLETQDDFATTTDGDYQPTSDTIVFPANSSDPQTFTVPVYGDETVELGETFLVIMDESSLETGGRNGVTVPDPTGTGNILNDDQATLSIDNVSQSEGNAGTTDFIFAVTLDAEVDHDVSIDLATQDDSATTADADYDANSGTLTFDANFGGPQTRTFTVVVNGDTKVELDEDFFVILDELSLDAGLRNVTVTNGTGTGTIENDDQATISINDVSMPEPIAGTVNFEFTVTLTGEVDNAVSFDAATADDTAVAPGDYVPTTETLSFLANGGPSQTATFTVVVNSDDVVEGIERFFVNLTNLAAGGRDVIFADEQGEGTILPDEPAELSINDVSQVETDSGTTVFTFTVTLDREVSESISVDVATRNGSATTADNDYLASSATLTFDAETTGPQTRQFTVSVVGDEKVELDETFFVDLSNLQAGGLSVAIIDGEGLGTIGNDDAATVSIDDVPLQVETDAGTTDFTFTVTLDREVDHEVTVDVETSDDTATVADDDYLHTTETLTFAANEPGPQTRTFTVSVNGDEKVELDEIFYVELSNVQAGERDVTIGDGTGMGAIQNDDHGIISIESGPVSQVETDSGTTDFTFTVTLDREVDHEVSVDVTTIDDTATTADSDYVHTTETLTFAANEPGPQTRTFTVAVNGDLKVELDEMFYVQLSNVQAEERNVTIGNDTGTGIIENDDQATVSINNVQVLEGDSGTTDFTFNVTLGRVVDHDVSVDVTTSDGTATVGDGDYVFKTETIVFPANAEGPQTRTFTVAVNGDEKVELNENFFAELSNPQAGDRDVIIGDGLGEAIIENDDEATVWITDVSEVEGDDGTTEFEFTVTLDGEVDHEVTVDAHTQNDDATEADGDYIGNSETLVFDANVGGPQTRTFSVMVSGDYKVETDETFFVILEDLQAGGRDVSFPNDLPTDTGIGTIVNDDTAPVWIDDVSLAEGDDGTTAFTFTVTLDGTVDHQVSVVATTQDGTATVSDNDYVHKTEAITFEANVGEPQTRSFTVSVVGDQKVELNEDFFVILSDLDAGGRAVFFPDELPTDTGTGTIENDDVATISIDDVSQDETDSGTTDFVFTVSLDNEVDHEVTVHAITRDDTATTADNDYWGGSETLVFPPGEQARTFIVSVVGDEKVELDERFFVDLSNIQAAGRFVGFAGGSFVETGTGTIVNDDDATVHISPVILPQPEWDTPFGFRVTLSATCDVPVSVLVNTADGLAIGGEDYVPIVDLPITFPAGDTQPVDVPVDVDIIQETIVELTEDFYVALSDIENGGREVAIADGSNIDEVDTAQGDILNDDQATITIGDVSLAEGDDGTTAFTFTVTLDNEVDHEVTVDAATRDGTATVADGDYVPETETITFAANVPGPQTQTFTVLVNGDLKVELDEWFYVDLTNIQADQRDVSFPDDVDTITATGNILNDDQAVVTISDASVAEGDSGSSPLCFDVSLSNPVDTTVTIDWGVTADTAQPGEDYLPPLFPPIEFAPGELLQQVCVDIVGDEKVELDETFFVELTNVEADQREVSFPLDLDTVIGTGTIVNDDQATISIGDVPLQVETDSGTTDFSFIVTLDEEVDHEVTVDVTTIDDTATTADGDYVYTTETLTFAANVAGPQERTFTVSVIGDAKVELNETFSAELSNAQAGGRNVIIGDGSGEAIIENDDQATISIGNVSQVETDAGTIDFTFTVTLDNEVDHDVSIDVETQDGTATTADSDYIAHGETVTFPAGVQTQTFTVSVIGDAKVELDETFQAILVESSIEAGGRNVDVGLEHNGLGTIQYDDSALITIEGDSRLETHTDYPEFTFTVTLNAEVDHDVTVDVATQDGTATTADSDYIAHGETVTFPAGVQTQTFTVSVIGDLKYELDEVFTVELDNLQAGDRDVEPDPDQSTGDGMIINDDDPPVISITGVEEYEGDAPPSPLHTEFVFKVSLSNESYEDIVIDYETVAGTATPDVDYTPTSGQLEIPAGDDEGQIVVQVIRDLDEELDESFFLDLSNPDPTKSTIADGSDPAQGLILDDDASNGSLAGVVYVDSNDNATQDAGEPGIPGVFLTLTGTDDHNQTVEITVMTAADGSYVFDQLREGDYTITESQPTAFLDGKQPGENQYAGIGLGRNEALADYDFGEKGLKPEYISKRMLLAIRPAIDEILREVNAIAQEDIGNDDLAAWIRRGEAPVVARRGGVVTVTGTSGIDTIDFVPGRSGERDHAFTLNGVEFAYDPDEDVDTDVDDEVFINTFRFNAGEGEDQAVIHDSEDNDLLEASGNSATLSSGTLFEAVFTDFEEIEAISELGGDDQVDREAVDFVLTLEGPWDEL